MYMRRSRQGISAGRKASFREKIASAPSPPPVARLIAEFTQVRAALQEQIVASS